MTGKTTTITIEQAREMLADIYSGDCSVYFEHPNQYLAWLLSTVEISGTPYKQGDLYKEIIEGTGGNPPNESP